MDSTHACARSPLTFGVYSLMQEEDDLEVECGKKIIENNALVSQDGNGINEEMTFENRISFDKFWDWFMPR